MLQEKAKLQKVWEKVYPWVQCEDPEVGMFFTLCKKNGIEDEPRVRVVNAALDTPANFLCSHVFKKPLQKIKSWPSSLCEDSLMVSRQIEQAYSAFKTPVFISVALEQGICQSTSPAAFGKGFETLSTYDNVIALPFLKKNP